ncbi:GAF and ANTAR domain-containing protein [Aquipuribacter sp. MA13-6]|uniref:GAF and ANTAR domain-containing protein n=1 Tax=unclassified Aquipuribacter TaxID=2635084 RepID=UPI003EEBCC9F
MVTDESRDDHHVAGLLGGRGEASAHDTGSHRGEDRLAQQLTRVARELGQSGSPAATLEGIVQAAVQLIPGVDEGSISLVLGRRKVWSEAATGRLPRAVDALQEETGQGPCVDAAYRHETVRVPDMAAERRWPAFAARAAEAGARGMLSFQLFVAGDDLGALNLYSYETGAFTDESEHVGLMFVSHAAIAYAAIRRQAQLTEAVATRLVIGQAQGMLMERHRLDEGRAFAVLIRASRNSNLKLRDVARHMVETRELPEAARPAVPG